MLQNAKLKVEIRAVYVGLCVRPRGYVLNNHIFTSIHRNVNRYGRLNVAAAFSGKLKRFSLHRVW